MKFFAGIFGDAAYAMFIWVFRKRYDEDRNHYADLCLINERGRVAAMAESMGRADVADAVRSRGMRRPLKVHPLRTPEVLE